MFRQGLASALIITALLIIAAESVSAETFCVSTSAELQNALTTAASNSEDDEIQIVQGTYLGNFIYGSTEAFGVTVKGGYSANCSSRTVDPENTVLDGQQKGVALVLSSNVESDFKLNGVTVQNGTADSDRNEAGIYAMTKGDLTFSNNTITNNMGEGVRIYHTQCSLLTNNTITNNAGDGVFVWELSSSLLTLDNNTIANNAGGVHIYPSLSSITLTNNTITNNSVGGGIYVRLNYSLVNLTNNMITDNITNFNGGYGGGVCLIAGSSSPIILSNNTITNNFANNGGGVYVSSETSTLNISNNVIWGNLANVKADDLYINNDGNNDYIPSPVNLYNNDFDQSVSGTYIEIPFTIDPSNLNNQDPLFVDPDNGDYHLQAGSPCIDKGINAAPSLPLTDLEGKPRIMNRVVDMGAYEYPGIVSGRAIPGVLQLLLLNSGG
jgi:parallel beta-helix repeat protein